MGSLGLHVFSPSLPRILLYSLLFISFFCSSRLDAAVYRDSSVDGRNLTPSGYYEGFVLTNCVLGSATLQTTALYAFVMVANCSLTSLQIIGTSTYPSPTSFDRVNITNVSIATTFASTITSPAGGRSLYVAGIRNVTVNITDTTLQYKFNGISGGANEKVAALVLITSYTQVVMQRCNVSYTNGANSFASASIVPSAVSFAGDPWNSLTMVDSSVLVTTGSSDTGMWIAAIGNIGTYFTASFVNCQFRIVSLASAFWGFVDPSNAVAVAAASASTTVYTLLSTAITIQSLANTGVVFAWTSQVSMTFNSSSVVVTTPVGATLALMNFAVILACFINFFDPSSVTIANSTIALFPDFPATTSTTSSLLLIESTSKYSLTVVDSSVSLFSLKASASLVLFDQSATLSSVPITGCTVIFSGTNITVNATGDTTANLLATIIDMSKGDTAVYTLTTSVVSIVGCRVDLLVNKVTGGETSLVRAPMMMTPFTLTDSTISLRGFWSGGIGVTRILNSLTAQSVSIARCSLTLLDISSNPKRVNTGMSLVGVSALWMNSTVVVVNSTNPYVWTRVSLALLITTASLLDVEDCNVTVSSTVNATAFSIALGTVRSRFVRMNAWAIATGGTPGGATNALLVTGVNPGGGLEISGTWAAQSATLGSSYAVYAAPGITQTPFTIVVHDAVMQSDTTVLYFGPGSGGAFAWAVNVTSSTLLAQGTGDEGIDRIGMDLPSTALSSTNVTIERSNITIITRSANTLPKSYNCSAVRLGASSARSMLSSNFTITSSVVNVLCGLGPGSGVSTLVHLGVACFLSTDSSILNSRFVVSNTAVTVVGFTAYGARVTSSVTSCIVSFVDLMVMTAGWSSSVGVDFGGSLNTTLAMVRSTVTTRLDLQLSQPGGVPSLPVQQSMALHVASLTFSTLGLFNSTLATAASTSNDTAPGAAFGAVVVGSGNSSRITVANRTFIVVRGFAPNVNLTTAIGAMSLGDQLADTHFVMTDSSVSTECIVSNGSVSIASLFIRSVANSDVVIVTSSFDVTGWNSKTLAVLHVGSLAPGSAFNINASSLALQSVQGYPTANTARVTGLLLGGTGALNSTTVAFVDSAVRLDGGGGALPTTVAAGVTVLAPMAESNVTIDTSTFVVSNFGGGGIGPAFVSVLSLGATATAFNANRVNITECHFVGSSSAVLAFTSNLDPAASTGNTLEVSRNKAQVADPTSLTWLNVTTTSSLSSAFATLALLHCNTVNSHRVGVPQRLVTNAASFPLSNLDCATATLSKSSHRTLSLSMSQQHNTSSTTPSRSTTRTRATPSNGRSASRSSSLSDNRTRSSTLPPKHRTRTRSSSPPSTSSRTKSPSKSQKSLSVSRSVPRTPTTSHSPPTWTPSSSPGAATQSQTPLRSSTLSRAATASQRVTASQTLLVVRVSTVPAVVTAAKATVAVTSAISSIISTPASALQASRALVAINLAYCDPGLDQGLDFMTSPTQWELGEGVERFYLGAAVGNIALVLGVFGLGMSFALGRYFLVLHRYALTLSGVVLLRKRASEAFVYSPYSNDGRNGQVSPTFQSCLAWARCPSFWLFVPMFVLQPTVTAVVTLVRFGTSATTIGLGCFLSLVVAASCAALGWLTFTATQSRCVYVNKERINAKEDRQGHQPVYRRVWRFLRREYGAWIDVPGASGYCRQYGALFDEYVGSAGGFNMVEVCFSVTLGVFAQLATGDSCFPMAIVIVVTYMVYLALVVFRRPHAMRMNFFFILITTSIQFFAAVIVCYVVYYGPASATDNVNSIVQLLSSVGMFLSILKTSFDLGYAAYRLVFRKYTLAEVTEEAEEAGLIPGKDRQRLAAAFLEATGDEPLLPMEPCEGGESIQNTTTTVMRIVLEEGPEEMTSFTPPVNQAPVETRRVDQFHVTETTGLNDKDTTASRHRDDGYHLPPDDDEGSAAAALPVSGHLRPEEHPMTTLVLDDLMAEVDAMDPVQPNIDLLDSLLEGDDRRSTSERPRRSAQPDEEAAAEIFLQLQSVLTRRADASPRREEAVPRRQNSSERHGSWVGENDVSRSSRRVGALQRSGGELEFDFL